MRILIIGAGVTGSIYASFLANNRNKLEKRLKESVEIKILARGETSKKITENGLKIKHHLQNIITIDQISVIKTLGNKDRYDYVLIFLRKTQLESLLPDLTSNNSKNFVFIGNNGTGIDHLKKSIPPRKIILGFPRVGGVKEGDTIRSVHKNRPPIVLGATNPTQQKLMRRLKKILRVSGITPKRSSNMDSWLKYHIALVSPLAYAIYADGGDSSSLSQNTELLKITTSAIREGYKALRELKYPVKPSILMIKMILPDCVIRAKLKRLLSSELGKLLIENHCNAAPEEIEVIAMEFQQLISNSSNEKKNLQMLYEQMI